jgi:hypothetical protein
MALPISKPYIMHAPGEEATSGPDRSILTGGVYASRVTIPQRPSEPQRDGNLSERRPVVGAPAFEVECPSLGGLYRRAIRESR